MQVTEPAAGSSAGAAKASPPVQPRGIQHSLFRVLLGVFTTPRGWWLISICFAAIVIWPARHHLSNDGLSYLDIGSEVSNGDLTALVNSVWSPAYPALIGCGFYLLRPSAAHEVPVLQLVNFFIFLFTLWAFTQFYKSWSTSIPEVGPAGSTGKALLTGFAFFSFLWFASCVIGFYSPFPDMFTAGLVFLVAATGCRLSRPGASWKHFAGLGALLGAGFYARAALFPLAFAFIALLFLSLARTSDIPRKKQLTYLAVTTAIFVAVAAPLIVALSMQEGRLSTGETGWLNYLWHVDGFEPADGGWVGGTPPEYGTPLHPPRKLMENPTVLEFATPIPGTYPLWHSPGYWYAGAKPVFNLRKQILAIGDSLDIYKGIALQSVGFLGGAIVLFLLSMGKKSRALPWRITFWLMAWPMVGCAMYALVHTEERYVAAFLLLICLEIYRALVFRVERRVAIGVCAVVVLVALAPLARTAFRSVVTTISQVRHPADEGYVVVAHSLQRLGLQPGDKLAVVGNRVSVFYARYDRLRVVSEIEDPDEFWRLNPTDLKRVEDLLASTGVKAIVAFDRPAGNQQAGWIEPHEARSLSVLLLQPARDGSH